MSLNKPNNSSESILRTQWLLGAMITLIPICIVVYFIFFWSPERPDAGQEQGNSEEVIDISSQSIAPAQPATLVTPNFDNATFDKEVPQEKLDAWQQRGQAGAGPLPPLDQSDDRVLEELAELSPQMEWYIWLYTDEVIRKFVTVIDNISVGTVAQKYISIPNPSTRFQSVEKDGSLYLDTASYQRYNVYTDMFISLDNADLVAIYQRYSPLLEQAFDQLGYPDKMSFNNRLLLAIDELLKAPVLESDIELERPTPVIYKFADPSLERLPDAHKQLIRMGPRNTRLIQQKLASLKPLLQDLN